MKHAKVVLTKAALDKLNAGGSILIRLPDVEITLGLPTPKISSVFDELFEGLFGKNF